MIQEDYCSFKLSKLLKEKGFNEDCKAYYEDGKFCWVWNDGCSRNTDNPKYVSCPSQALAMKWLRKKGIRICIDYNNMSEDWYATIAKEYDGQLSERIRSELFTLYEDAVETAIKYSLENLI